MKTPKFITAMAEEIASKDRYFDADTVINQIMSIRRALLRGRFYASVDTVSRSGMSRTIKLGYIENDQYHNLPEFAYRLAGCQSNNGYQWRIVGCGMDMLFAAQYNLFRALCPKHKYQTAMKRYNNI